VSDDAAQRDAGTARLRLLTIQPLLVSSLHATCLFLFANVRGRCRGRARPQQCCIMMKLPLLRTAACPEVPMRFSCAAGGAAASLQGFAASCAALELERKLQRSA
jgi:hypothetical protein